MQQHNTCVHLHAVREYNLHAAERKKTASNNRENEGRQHTESRDDTEQDVNAHEFEEFTNHPLNTRFLLHSSGRLYSGKLVRIESSSRSLSFRLLLGAYALTHAPKAFRVIITLHLWNVHVVVRCLPEDITRPGEMRARAINAETFPTEYRACMCIFSVRMNNASRVFVRSCPIAYEHNFVRYLQHTQLAVLTTCPCSSASRCDRWMPNWSCAGRKPASWL